MLFYRVQGVQSHLSALCQSVLYNGTRPVGRGKRGGIQNEMAYLEFIHNLVETMDKYFENVCELDIMYNIEKAHYILDEMIMNGHIV